MPVSLIYEVVPSSKLISTEGVCPVVTGSIILQKKKEPKEFNYLKYKENTIFKAMKIFNHGKTENNNLSLKETIFNMDAKIQSLKTENNVLREIIDWDKGETK